MIARQRQRKSSSPDRGATKMPGVDDVAAGIWARVIRFAEKPSSTAARALLKLQFAEADQRRMNELSDKARSGMLTKAEEREADAYERLGCLLDIVHSHARRALQADPSK